MSVFPSPHRIQLGLLLLPSLCDLTLACDNLLSLLARDARTAQNLPETASLDDLFPLLAVRKKRHSESKHPYTRKDSEETISILGSPSLLVELDPLCETTDEKDCVQLFIESSEVK